MPLTSRTQGPAQCARWALLIATLPGLACHCESADLVETSSDTSSSGTSNDTWTTSTDESTGAPFDSSRWIGRYHYEDPWLDFGERGDPIGPPMLINFEIRDDSTASLLYDDCGTEAPVSIDYRWAPSPDGGLLLLPGEGETRLRFMADDTVEILRVKLDDPCRQLWFESDGDLHEWLPFHPGASCWVDRCTTGNILHIDYCEGEEPPPCP